MTYPGADAPHFEDNSQPDNGEAVNMESPDFQPGQYQDFIEKNPYPAPLIDLTPECEAKLKDWLMLWVTELEMSWIELRDKWAREEEAYRALTLGPQTEPFVGACGDVVPAIAMAVDPVFARLNGVTKEKSMMRAKALRRAILDYMPSFETFLQFYFTHINPLRPVMAPRLLEVTKHGTMALKISYDRTTYDIQGYDNKWEPEKRKVTLFNGPRISGVALGDIMFPPHYQHLQDCPIVVERHRVTWDTLCIWSASGKIDSDALDSIKGQVTTERTATELQSEDSNQHRELTRMDSQYYIIHEIWCDYDVDEDGIPERLAILYHLDSQTFLSRRYNWYFHQKKPYVVAPYQLANDSLLGVGLCEVLLPFQDMLTAWHRHATNNAFLANARMWAVSKGCTIEDKPKIVTNRVFRMDNPDKDMRPLQMGDTYPSTLAERQNLFGLMEKRSGVSDYLTGRESPIIGSRATATSTVALIKEGTKRVEEVLDNVRSAMAEAQEMCLFLWVQYGLGDITDIAFGDDKVANDVNAFMSTLSRSNVTGAVAIDLSAIDAANNQQIQQQAQMAIITQMMQYYQKVIEAGQLAVQTAQIPPLMGLVTDTMTAARKLYLDLQTKFNVPNPEEYLPMLEEFINGLQQISQPPAPGGPGGQQAGPPGSPGQSSLPPDLAAMLSGQGNGSSQALSGRPPLRPVPSAGASGGA